MKWSSRLTLGLLAVPFTLAVVFVARQAATRNGQKALELKPQTAASVAASAIALRPDASAAVQEERAAAMRVKCLHNLKRLGLAVRVWALDNGDMMPPGVWSLTNVLSTPEILACPADAAHPAAAGGWASYAATNCSYEYLAPSTPDGTDPSRVVFWCRVHGNITLSDGSVRPSVGKDHPDWLVRREGEIYYEPPSK